MAKTTLILGNLRTERLENGRRTLIRSLGVQIGDEEIIVPAGITTDFSSIPWWGRILVRWSRVDIAGVVHDWLYQTAAMSRREADQRWRSVARAGDHRANAFQAWVGYIALRLGGWIAWNRHRRQNQSPRKESKAEGLHSG